MKKHQIFVSFVFFCLVLSITEMQAMNGRCIRSKKISRERPFNSSTSIEPSECSIETEIDTNLCIIFEAIKGLNKTWTDEDERKLSEDKAFAQNLTAVLIHWPEEARQKCIYGAAYHCQPNVLKVLLQDLRVQLEDNGTLALFAALEMGYEKPRCAETAKLLIDYGADANSLESLDEKDKSKITPFFAAAKRAAQTGIMTPFKVLLQNGADPQKVAYFAEKTHSVAYVLSKATKLDPKKFSYTRDVIEAIVEHSKSQSLKTVVSH